MTMTLRDYIEKDILYVLDYFLLNVPFTLQEKAQKQLDLLIEHVHKEDVYVEKYIFKDDLIEIALNIRNCGNLIIEFTPKERVVRCGILN